MLGDIRNSFLVLAAVALCLAALWTLRRRHPHNMDIYQKTLVATNLGFFATLYTFFLGFAVVTLWQTFNDVSSSINDETDLLLVEYRLSFEMEHSQDFRQALLGYVDWVKGDGWARMRQDNPEDGSGTLYEAIWAHMKDMKPAAAAQMPLYQVMLEKLIDLNKLRHKRLLSVAGNLYTPIWVLIYCGVLFTIVGFHFIDSGKKVADVYFMAMMLTMILGNIFLLYELDTPFSGLISIGPEKFEQVRQAMGALGGP